MRRKIAAVLTVLALAACFGRVSAWAGVPGDAHACCRNDSSAPAKAPTLAECCPALAAAHALKTVPSQMTFVVVAAPSLAPSSCVTETISGASSPPGPQTLGASVPARAPPLA